VTDLFTIAGAVISGCERYRYLLTRTWDPALRPAGFIMLNPSTADATLDDPTIRRCVGFAQSWGAGGIWVANLFGLRATDPRALYKAADPVGPDNDAHVRRVAEQCRPVVAAWGVHGCHLGRDLAVAKILAAVGVPVMCLGVTKAGRPRHPLYLPADSPLVPFVVAGAADVPHVVRQDAKPR
jgi:hypothetical protein